MGRLVGRHRHVANVRADGIAVVLGPLLRDARIRAAALVDVDSGMVLDAWSAAVPADDVASDSVATDVLPGAPDLELVGAQHAEVVRCALALLRAWPSSTGPEDDTCEVVLGADGGRHHLLRTVPDPHGDRLALAVVVDGSSRALDRVRKRLRSVAVDALTAGPSMTRRPVRGAWSFAMPGPDVPASAAFPAPLASPERVEPSDDVRPHALPSDDAEPDEPASEQPVPVPSASPQPALLHPALARLDAGRIALPVPRNGQRDPSAAVPAPPVAAPPRSAQVDAPTLPRGPHLRPVPAQPAAGSPRTPAAGDDAGPRRPPVDPRRPPSPAAAVRPSPPAALPAPPRPRRP